MASSGVLFGVGAGLRISGQEPAGEWLTGSNANRTVRCEFDIPAGGGAVELVAELRAKSGAVRFALDSLRLVRLD